MGGWVDGRWAYGRGSSVRLATIERCATRQVSRQDLMRQLKWQRGDGGGSSAAAAGQFACLSCHDKRPIQAVKFEYKADIHTMVKGPKEIQPLNS